MGDAETIVVEPERGSRDRSGRSAIAWWPVTAVVAATVLVFAVLSMLPATPPPAQSTSRGSDVVAVAPTASSSATAIPSESGSFEGRASPQASEPLDMRTLPPSGGGEPGRLETTGEQLMVWEDEYGAVRAEVVVTLRNAGGSPIEVDLSGATWTVSDDAGERVASGRFAHAFPPVLEAGGVAYLIDGVSAAFAEPDELARLDVDIEGEPAKEDALVHPLAVDDVKWTSSDDEGVVVSGRIENQSTAAVSEAYVCVVLKGDRQDILAAVYDVAVGPLDAGEARTFDTAYPGTPHVEPRDVATAEAIGIGRATDQE
jgi:hypothetical protein